MPRKNKGPAREPGVVFAGKMEASFKTATNLLAKLQAMQRHRAIRMDSDLRARYAKFVSAIAERVAALGPIEAGTQTSETLDSWLQ